MLKLTFILAVVIFCVDGCGITTHIEISHRAKTYFQDQSGSKVDYGKLIQKHNDALMAGSPYPDAYYDSICAGGKYHSVSEDTHWANFLNVSANYIREKYPQPWDEATEKLVVFLFGVVSHQVADIVWHSLGIQQGFLSAMGKMNFHGSFDAAHSVGDFGGDILVNYEMNLTYIPEDQGWYIPSDDLFNIYTLYYGTKTAMPIDIITGCSAKLFLERLAEVIGAKELFPDYAKKSAWMVDNFEKYFLGGVDDMAAWTDTIWQQTILMLEHGTQVCDIPKSTIFLQCNHGNNTTVTGADRSPGTNGYFVRPPNNGVSKQDFTIEKTLRGVRVKPSQLFMDKLKKKRQNQAISRGHTPKQQATPQSSSTTSGAPRQPDKILYVKNDYAKLGKIETYHKCIIKPIKQSKKSNSEVIKGAYATGDLNFDGKPDLVVSAPGYGRPGSPQEGRVYIIYGDGNGLPSALTPDLDDLEFKGQGQIIKGWGTAQSRFGESVAVVDINLDGADDIAIGAPALNNAGDSKLQYNGQILIYFGIPAKRGVARGAANITVACDKIQYCNLGYTMTSGDVNHDGDLDLVFGSPFTPGPYGEAGEQRGLMSALFSSKYNTGYQYIEVSNLKYVNSSAQNYSWYGHDIVFGSLYNEQIMFVSSPEYRKCALANCSFSDSDTQAVGSVEAISPSGTSWTSQGTSSMAQHGWSVDIGTPYAGSDTHVVAVSELGHDVEGHIAGVGFTFSQAGQVVLYNWTQGQTTPVKLNVVLQGDRAFGRFGAKVKFLDVNHDGLSDLLVGVPLRSEDITEELYGAEQGRVFIYYGGADFPYNPSEADCGNSWVHPCPRLQSSLVLEWPNEQAKTRFGSQFGFLKGANQSQLFATAEHASTYGRLAGAIGLFNF